MESSNTEREQAGARTSEHAWLRRFVGEWAYEGEAMEPGKAPAKFSGSESVRSIGDLWVVAEGQGQMPDGSQATMLMTLGYDPQRKRFVGTWVGSMMANLWVYDGALDSEQRVLTLDSDGPSMTGDGTTAKYRDVIEFEGQDQRVLTSYVLGENGTWQKMMTSSYRRTK